MKRTMERGAGWRTDQKTISFRRVVWTEKCTDGVRPDEIPCGESEPTNGVQWVTTNRKISVTAWNELQDPVISEKRAHRHFWPPGVIGLAGSLLLHGLVLQTVVLGSRANKNRLPEVQEPESSINKPADALVFIDLPKTAKTTDEIYEALASVRAAIKDSPIPVTHPDSWPPRDVKTLAPSEDKDSESSVDNGDGAERARLFGIYSGQIQARIERVWRRPRTPVNDGSGSMKTTNSVEYFRCQVQIVQDSIGNVQEIRLPNCVGSVPWQRSLVIAIQQASPLPAPPSPTVFNHNIALTFVGYPYVVGGSDEGYEPESKEVMRAFVDTTSRRTLVPPDLPTGREL